MSAPDKTLDQCYDALRAVRAQLRRVEDMLVGHNPELVKVAHVRQAERVQKIMRLVGKHYEVSAEWFTNRRRGTETISWPRQVAMYFTREFTQLSLSEIGCHFAGRDHGTVLHACKCVQSRIDVYPDQKKTLLHIRALIIRDLTPAERNAA